MKDYENMTAKVLKILKSDNTEISILDEIANAQKVAVTNGNDLYIWENGAITCANAVHKRVIDSEEFLSSYCWYSVADNADIYLHIKTGAKTLHGNVSIESDGKCYGKLFEGPTLSNDGTGLDENCLNRETIITPDSTIFYDPTVSNDGTCLECRLLGTAGMFTASGGNILESYWLLDHDSSYLIKVTNKSGGTSDVCINCQWHEHTAV